MEATGKKTLRSKTGVRQVGKEMKRKYASRPRVCFVLQDWEDGYNVGSMFRIADCLGAELLVLTGRTPVPEENPMIAVTSMGHHRRIAWEAVKSHEEAVLALKEKGWSIIAVEIAEGSVDYREFGYPESCCFVLGNEGAGVYGSVMKHRDAAIFIPMFGKARSLNVTVAGALVAAEAAFSSAELREPQP